MADDNNIPPPPEEPQAPPPPGQMAPPGPMAPPQSYSNYPRAPLFRAWYNRPPGVYFDSINTAFDMIRSNWGVYAACSFITLLVFAFVYYPVVFVGMMAMLANPFLAVVPFTAVSMVITFLTLCMVSLGVEHARGVPLGMDSFFLPFKRFGVTVAACAIVSIPVLIIEVVAGLFQTLARSGASIGGPATAIVGLLLVVVYIAQLLAQGPLMLAATAAVFSDYKPVDAFAETLKRGGWRLLLFSLVFLLAGFASGLGLFLLCIGIIFTLPIYSNVVALHYLYFFPNESRTQPVQPAYQA